MSTIAGTGHQGNDKEGGAMGTDQEISSPWDLALGNSPDSSHPNLLYVAMAGTHQIWLHFFEDAIWTKGRYEHETKGVVVPKVQTVDSCFSLIGRRQCSAALGGQATSNS